MIVHRFKTIAARPLWAVLLTVACMGCGSKHRKVIEASPEQQKKWEDEENAAREKKLQEARAAGQVQ